MTVSHLLVHVGLLRTNRRRLSVHRLSHCAHEDIIAPAFLCIVGPLLDRVTGAAGR